MRTLKSYAVLTALLTALLTASSLFSMSVAELSLADIAKMEEKMGRELSFWDIEKIQKQRAAKAVADKIAAQQAAELAKRWECTITSGRVVVTGKDKEYEIRTSSYTSVFGPRVSTKYKNSQGTIKSPSDNCYFTFSKAQYEVRGDEGSCAWVYRKS